MVHYSVMKNEVIDSLNIKKEGIYVDATLGYGGHSSEVLKKLTTGHLYCFDQDKDAILYSSEILSEIGDNFTIIHSNFSDFKSKLEEIGVDKIDGIIFDLGLSSPQIDNTERGFSFMRDASLDMRMNLDDEVSAFHIVNNYSMDELTNIFYIYGEERLSKAIAKKIVDYRSDKKINTTMELVSVIDSAVGKKYFSEYHPERKIFQAIRIEVNRELKVLEEALPDAINLLNKDGRICVLTFHSLEDRIVKNIFKEFSELDEMVRGLPVIPQEFLKDFRVLNKKPILASEKELIENKRSKSAKLRVGEKL